MTTSAVRARRRRRTFIAIPASIPVPRVGVWDRVDPLWVLAGALVLSAAVHLTGVRGLSHLRGTETPMRTSVTLRVAVVPKPTPIAEVIPEQPTRVVPLKRVARVSPTPASPAPVSRQPVETPPPPLPPQARTGGDEAPPMLIAGVALSATSTTGTMRVGVGNSSSGARSNEKPSMGEGKPYHAQEFVASYGLTEEPVFLDNVSPEQMRRLYPEAARREKIEDVVRVKLIVDDDGSVAKVTVVSEPGNGFREAALKVARLYRFKPARVNGRAVATEITFTIHFVLD